jgi:hypothetical protein
VLEKLTEWEKINPKKEAKQRSKTGKDLVLNSSFIIHSNIKRPGFFLLHSSNLWKIIKNWLNRYSAIILLQFLMKYNKIMAS